VRVLKRRDVHALQGPGQRSRRLPAVGRPARELAQHLRRVRGPGVVPVRPRCGGRRAPDPRPRRRRPRDGDTKPPPPPRGPRPPPPTVILAARWNATTRMGAPSCRDLRGGDHTPGDAAKAPKPANNDRNWTPGRPVTERALPGGFPLRLAARWGALGQVICRPIERDPARGGALRG